MGFHDHFSAVASPYAAHRPTYPASLFDDLARTAPSVGRAWDVGTGSGQAARGLAERFAEVVATDPSAEPLARATPHRRVVYRLGREADSGIEAGTVDLVAEAQSAHWFDQDAFHRESRRAGWPIAIRVGRA